MTLDRAYPIGKFQRVDSLSPEQRTAFLAELAALPAQYVQQVAALSAEQLAQPYRVGGWTGVQVVHHVADSHAQALTRVKWTLTEAQPTIKAYDETAWALLPDYGLPIAPSLQMFEIVVMKFVYLLEQLQPEQWQRSFIHPENQRSYSLDQMLALYTWHAKHHLAHLALLAELA